MVGVVNAIMNSPYWQDTAIIIAYDDSDGWYDHVLGPVVNQSAVSDDALAGAGDLRFGNAMHAGPVRVRSSAASDRDFALRQTELR